MIRDKYKIYIDDALAEISRWRRKKMNDEKIPRDAEIKLEIKEEQRKLYERLLGIVHCKDCSKFFYDESRDLWYCGAWSGLGGAEEDDYCSYGERKDD